MSTISLPLAFHSPTKPIIDLQRSLGSIFNPVNHICALSLAKGGNNVRISLILCYIVLSIKLLPGTGPARSLGKPGITTIRRSRELVLERSRTHADVLSVL